MVRSEFEDDKFKRTFVITDPSLSKALRSDSGTRRKILDMLYERG